MFINETKNKKIYFGGSGLFMMNGLHFIIIIKETQGI